MKAKAKIIILITLGILFTFSPIISINLKLNSGSSDNSTDYSDDINFDSENVKLSAISGKIHIDNNWTAAKAVGICTGNGTYSEPYVIEDLIIDGGDSGSCIWIENSDVFFKIENCTVYNSGLYPGAGITLLNVNNSRLIDNNCSSNCRGINLRYSNNNTISGNIVSNSESRGIRLDSSDNNTISGNTANNNYWDGIYLDSSNNNTISGNTANNNNLSGIDLYSSDNNTISGNTVIGNDECIVESEDCQGNTFSDNGGCTYGGIPIELIILISVISGGAVIGVATLLLLIRKRKRIELNISKYQKNNSSISFRNPRLLVKRASKTVFLVFAIISLVVGTFFMAFWTFILVFTLYLDAQFPGAGLTQEGYFIVYFALSMGIVFIIVAIILFVLRAKKAD